jgi:hypothetical protein
MEYGFAERTITLNKGLALIVGAVIFGLFFAFIVYKWLD